MASLMQLKQGFMRDIKHPLSWVCVVIVLMFVLTDFVSRVWVPLSKDEVTSGAGSALLVPEVSEGDFLSPQSYAWRQAQLADAAGADVEPVVVVPDTQPLAELMAGAEQLGDHLVRIRAIFTSSSSGRRLALAELQNLQDREIGFNQLQQGDQVGSYSVTNIDGQFVVFAHSDGTEIRVSVFDWHPDFESVPESEPRDTRRRREEFDEIF